MEVNQAMQWFFSDANSRSGVTAFRDEEIRRLPGKFNYNNSQTLEDVQRSRNESCPLSSILSDFSRLMFYSSNFTW
jgi:hypothetical protein